MSLHASKGKGKFSSIETDWSPWEWNDAGYWESHRTNDSGAIEYQRGSPMTRSTENATTPRSAGVFDDQYALPRYSGPNPLSNSEQAYSSAQPAADDYSTSKTSTDSGVSYLAPQAATDYSNLNMPAVPGRYGPSSSDTYEQSERGAFQQDSSNYFASAGWYSSEYSDTPTPSPGPQEQDFLDTSTHALSSISLGDPKPIYREPGSRSYETLDPRYRAIPEKEQSNFWKVGRVFMMLWTEPAGPQVPAGGGTTPYGSHLSTTWLNQRAYSEIRRFVVIAEGYGNCICSPIQTYSGRATLRPNLPDRQQHAIIYTSKYPPEEHSEKMSDGTVVRESLTKDPIRVMREQRGPEGEMSPLSRINYSKIYTVEHYVRVLNIGMVHKDSLDELVRNSRVYRDPTTQTSRKLTQDIRSGRSTKSKGKSADLRKKGIPTDNLRATGKDSDSEPMLPNNSSVGNLTSRLNDRYQIIGAPSRFFKKGRVFKALWTEPVGDLTNTEDLFLIPSRYGENAFTKIRHFVVVREKQGCCLCLMLNTYNRQGASKDGIKAENYAAAYPLGGNPEVSPKENLTKEPFPIKVEEAGESIDPTSRINFGRVYTVEHNIKVLKVGRIPNDFLPRLEEYFVSSIVGP